MSLSRHAYRHALRPPRNLPSDSPWIGDDLIAAAFHRFVHSQRRNGSSVPGPMEARRRLAKRRNTALAGFGGAEDIACLFGRNGREHMKWTDHPWQRTHAEALDRSNYASSAHDTALPFYDHHPEPIVPEINNNTPKHEEQSLERIFEHFASSNTWALDDARDFVRRFRIDLQREPVFSQQLFENILSRPSANLAQVIQFLDDPFLNTAGSGNYIVAVDYSQKKKPSDRATILNAVTRALELGLVPADELCLILKALPQMVQQGKQPADVRRENLQKWNYAMWEAIGQCSILGYKDLDKKVVQVWLKELIMADIVPLAREIVIATHNADSTTEWPSALILSSLERARGKTMPSHLSPSELLNRLDPVCAANCIIHITELLVSRTKEGRQVHLLNLWQDSLLEVSTAEAIAVSQSWTDLPLAYLSSLSSHERVQVQQQILSRLWALRVLSTSLGRMYKKGLRATDRPSCVLFYLFESVTSYTEECFLANLLRGIHDLNLPYSGLLMSAVDLKLQNVLQPAGRRTICELENSEISLADVWRIPALYQGVQRIFHGSFEQMVRRMDLTSPAFVEEALHLASTGDSLNIWFIMRLLRNHAPFQICLNKAWVPIPHPDEKALVRYHSGPRSSHCPDPYVAADLIHQLAVVFASNPNLSPRRAYYLVYCLYYYSRRHGSPVYPSLVRALFHAGVVRFREEKLHVSAFRYDWIMWIVKKFEGDEVVEELVNSPELRALSSQRH